jgi:hypothetical protein
MVTGAAESWYHEKQSSWLCGIVAAGVAAWAVGKALGASISG